MFKDSFGPGSKTFAGSTKSTKPESAPPSGKQTSTNSKKPGGPSPKNANVNPNKAKRGIHK